MTSDKTCGRSCILGWGRFPRYERKEGGAGGKKGKKEMIDWICLVISGKGGSSSGSRLGSPAWTR